MQCTFLYTRCVLLHGKIKLNRFTVHSPYWIKSGKMTLTRDNITTCVEFAKLKDLEGFQFQTADVVLTVSKDINRGTISST